MPAKHLVVVMACVLLIAGCGEAPKGAPKRTVAGFASEAPAPKTPAAVAVPGSLGAMADLVPAGTMVFGYVPSLERLEDGIGRIAATTGSRGGRGGKAVDFAMLARQMGLDLKDFDLAQPVGIAMTQSAGARAPSVTALLPVRDEKAAVARIKGANPRASVDAAGGYVALTLQGPYKRGRLPEFLKAPMPEGDIVIRLDVPGLWATYGPLASAAMEMGLASMDNPRAKGRQPAADVQAVLDEMKSFAEAASTCDLALRAEGTVVEVDTTVRFVDGAKVPMLDVFGKADLAALARALPNEGMMSFGVAMNPEKLWASLEPLARKSLDKYPKPARAMMAKALDSFAAASKTLGDGMVLAGGITDGRLEFVAAMATPDPAACLKTMMAMNSEFETEESPLRMHAPEERTVEGVKVTTVRFKVDAATMSNPSAARRSREAMTAMFGNEDLTCSYVALENRLLVVMGSDDLLSRAIKAGQASAGAPATPTANALAAAGADTVGYLRLELNALARATAAIAGAGRAKGAPKTPAPSGDPVPLTITLNAGSGELRCRMSVDVGKASKLSSVVK